MNKDQLMEFCLLRFKDNLGKEQDDEIAEWLANTFIDQQEDGETWVNDPAHGYLIVRPNHPLYNRALAMLTQYDYQLNDGTILLEEDVQAPLFLEKETE
jgi:hypothetical protein